MPEEVKQREWEQGTHWVTRGPTDLSRAVDTRGAKHELILKSLVLRGCGPSCSCLSFTILEVLNLNPRPRGKRTSRQEVEGTP